ncbi:hypothetical protein JOF53_005641 [Crossiella equi]|uniref:SapB/AmfS family lantipeptide n=1 Tax=Crossiella equi TaxID=130796 RepID=A0ABS5AKM9_9PSEU|nr:SapB/AmfS family lanthipeptide [Crossiella equi]MBP2476769.1 hypothetical protein [Crossiella equi]
MDVLDLQAIEPEEGDGPAGPAFGPAMISTLSLLICW